jgi:isoamylase
MKILRGTEYPLGATFDGSGVNFSIFSEAAERVDLCLFDEAGNESRVQLPEVSGYCWHGYLAGLRPGQRYGYRIHGPWEPAQGQRCCPAKLLLDPYATSVDGNVQWDDAVFPYRFDEPQQSSADADDARFVPKSVVTSPFFDWRMEHHPNVPLDETILYEVHVKGFTKLHPGVPAALRGTYAGLAQPVVIDYFKSLGITAVELMPIHQFVHDRILIDRGLRNYWGYNSICYFAPHHEYSAAGYQGQQVQEFKQMVHDLHEAGVEVILDVVYNHTAEGNHLGPVLSYKGIDNRAYYRLVEDDLRHYMDYTGTGNSLNMRHPRVLQLVMDSLRYWITEMHVDGFRFDLAAALARELKDVDRLSAFFDIIHQDPVIRQVKLIAEPWDVGEGGYQVGRFPVLWSEWNGVYRDTMRDFWRGQEGTLGQFASRFTGSSDLYENTGRKPRASINFVTAHDGYTLHDLVTYGQKHNEANGEENRDGEDHNRSWNCGEEGPTRNQHINALRIRQKYNLLTTLLLSQGVPMLLAGDEMGHTQHGNNNAYCQDNELTWLNWQLGREDKELFRFVRYLIRLRKQHPIFRRRGFFQGREIAGAGVKDLTWLTPAGLEMTQEEWQQSFFARCLGLFLAGDAIDEHDERGRRIRDDNFILLLNSHHEDIPFILPAEPSYARWEVIVDTSHPDGRGTIGHFYSSHGTYPLQKRSMVMLRQLRSRAIQSDPDALPEGTT